MQPIVLNKHVAFCGSFGPLFCTNVVDEDDDGGCGQKYGIKKRRLTWMKYIDDGDHFGENFDDLACKHSCSFCENWY